ncbi:flagellin [Xanthobacteraceae bacterium Astr-EGSB]|uniref:flagellin N-terminal helical domain-containing protein n=1 Tax=Astrobacterium formosum TaxID=3069710 RepID=UPI0027B636B4|nr:flagellin [Xanthobacteraceae bacterium Astr-EGSB]
MSSGITLSAGVRQNLLSLQNTAAMMTSTQNKLSTGKKVNSALDNPTNFFTSSSLSARAGDLNSLMDSMSNGVKTIEAADNGLTSITKTLESMQSTLRQARQDKSFESASFTVNVDPAGAKKLALSGGSFETATDFELTATGSGQYVKTTSDYSAPAAAAKSAVATAVDLSAGTATVRGGTLTIAYGGSSVDVTIADHLVAGTQVANIKAELTAGLAGTALDGKLVVGDDGSGHVNLTAAANEDAQIAITGTANTITDTFGANVTGTQGSNGKTEFSVNGTAVELTTAETTAALAVAKINEQLGSSSKFQAYADVNKVGIRATTTDAGSLAIGGTDAGLFGTKSAAGIVSGTTSAALTLSKTVDNMVSEINNSSTFNTKIKASNDNGKLRLQNLSTQKLDVAGTNTSGVVTGKATDTSSIAGNSVRADLSSQYNELRDQLDKLADDGSFNGINLLRGDKLTLTFNENGTSSIAIQSKGGKSVDSQNLGLSTTINAKDLDSDTNIDTQINKIKSALTSVRSQSSAFGNNLSIVENRQDFTKSMMNTLQIGADQLVLADSNEEGANMLALQTRQQLSTTALSLANQANQAVLRLF